MSGMAHEPPVCSESLWFIHVAHLCFVSLWFIHSCHDVLLHGDRRRKRVVTRSAVQPSAVHGLGLSDLFSYPSTVAALKYMSSTEDEISKARRPPSKCGIILAPDSVSYGCIHSRALLLAVLTERHVPKAGCNTNRCIAKRCA